MDNLKKQAAELGIDVDGRWSEDTLREKISAALAGAPTNFEAVSALPREKTLHELNLEQRAIDRALRGLNDAAAEAARTAVSDVLNERRPNGKRFRKNLRPNPEF